MRHRTKLLVALALLTSSAACSRHRAVVAAGSPEDIGRVAPPWFTLPPRKDGYLYGAQSAESSDLSMAVSRARLRARGEVAMALELRFQGLLKSFGEQTGGSDNAHVLTMFSETYKVVLDETLTGSQVTDSRIVTGPRGYTVFALMELPIGEANKAFVAKAREREALWSRLQATKAFAELQAEIERGEQRDARAARVVPE